MGGMIMGIKRKITEKGGIETEKEELIRKDW